MAENFLKRLISEEQQQNTSSKHQKDDCVMEHLINFSFDDQTQPMMIEQNSFAMSTFNQSADNINLMEFSFNLINSFSDSKNSLQTNLLFGGLESFSFDENIEVVIEELIKDMLTELEKIHLPDQNQIVILADSIEKEEEEEEEDKENIRPINQSPLSSFDMIPKNLSRDLFEAKVEEAQHKFEKNERIIFKEFDLDLDVDDSSVDISMVGLEENQKNIDESFIKFSLDETKEIDSEPKYSSDLPTVDTSNAPLTSTTVLEEASFTYEDRVDLLQTKLIYENQIVELQERLERQIVIEQDEMKDQLSTAKIEFDSVCQKYQQEVEKLHQQCTVLNDKLEEQKILYENINDDYEEALQKTRLENAALRNKYETTLVLQMNELKQCYELLSRQYYESQNENEKLKEAILDMDSQRNQLRQRIEALNSEVQNLNTRLSNLSQERDQLLTQIDDLKLNCDQEKNSDSEQKLLESRLKEAEEKIESLRSALNDHQELQAKYAQLWDEYQEYLKKFEQECLIESRLNDEVILLRSLKEKDEEEIQELTEKLHKLTDQLKKSNFDLKQEIVHAMEMKMLADEYSAKNEQIKTTVEEYQSKLDEIQDGFNESETKLNQYKADNEKLKEILKQNQEKHEKCQDTIYGLQMEIRNVSEENLKIMNEKSFMENKLHDLEHKLFEYEEQNVQIETKLEKAHEEMVKIKSEFSSKEDDWNEKLVELQTELDSKEQSARDKEKCLEEECQKLTEKIEQHKQSIQNLQTSYENLSAEHESCGLVYEEKVKLSEELVSLRHEQQEFLERLKETNDQWQQSKEELLNENNCLKQTIQEISEKLSNMIDLTEELKKDKSELENRLKNGDEQLKSKYEEISRRFFETERSNQDLESRLNVLVEKNKKISSEFAAEEKQWFEKKSLLEQRLTASQKRLNSIDSEFECLRSEKRNLENTLESMQTELTETKSKLIEQDEVAKRSVIQLKQKSEDLLEQQKIINTLKQEFNALQSIHESSVQELKNDLDNLRNESEKRENQWLDEKLKMHQHSEDLMDQMEKLTKEKNKFTSKYLSLERVWLSNENQLKFMIEVGKCLDKKLEKLIFKVDAHKNDSISNDKVKTMLEEIRKRVQSFCDDGSKAINVKKQQPEPLQQPMHPSSIGNATESKGLKQRAFKPIECKEAELMIDDIRRQQHQPSSKRPQSLNETNKENIV